MAATIESAETLLRSLVAIPSCNTMGRPVSGPEYGEARVTQFLETWLRQFPLEIRRQPVQPGRENLLATWRSPTTTGRHVLLEVHQDTVPIDQMTIEPFAGKVANGRLYGRGACDDKGPMTSMLLALARLATERPAAASVTLALVVDEEHQFTGVTELVREPLGVTEAIVAEPTELEVVIAHKGLVRWAIEVAGIACHSSDPTKGVSAIYRMARLIRLLEDHADELTHRPADPLLGTPTLSIGVINGGASVNIVPDRCRIEIDRRLIPGETPASAQADALAVLREHPSIDFPFDSQTPFLQSTPLDPTTNRIPTERLLQSLRRLELPAKTKAVPFGTDAHALSRAGIPTVVFGPGSIAQAHTKDEWVELEQVRQAADVYFDFCC